MRLRKLEWAREILEHCSMDIESLVNCTPHPVCNMIRNRKTQVDAAKAILTEIIEEREKQRELAPCDRK